MFPVPQFYESLSAIVTLSINPMNVLIVLAGQPPSKSLLKTEMGNADLVLAVDGGYNTFKTHMLKPDLVLGDLDSAAFVESENVETLKLSDQNQTDLQKTLTHVLESYPVTSVVILGAGGNRTDHLMHNLQICALVDDSVKILFKNELPSDIEFSMELIQRVTRDCDFDQRVKQGTTLSILPGTEYTSLNTQGLKWEISNQDSSTTFICQSNLSIKADPSFKVSSGVAYIAVYQ